jgi:branched-chain amino acid transport system permease protein
MHLSGAWLDYTVNGLVIGNIYALLAVGLALIFGVSNLINFAHGSIYSVGAYVGWLCLTQLQLPLLLTVPVVLLVSALLGIGIERLALRPLHGTSRIAPLLATIGVGLVLDQIVQLVFTPNPRALPSPLPDWRWQIGGGSIGTLDLLILFVGVGTATALYCFLRFTKLGWAVRATAQDLDAAKQMGVDVDRVNSSVFAIAAALGGLSGLLVGMYYNSIDPNMSFDATLKGVVALIIGGMGNVPGAIAGSLMLGLIESYGIALFGTSYRNLFAFAVLILILVFRPSGLFASSKDVPPEPMTGSFLARGKPVRIPVPALYAIVAFAAVLPFVASDYVLQTGTNALLYGLLALSLTLVAGTVGMISLGHAGLLAIGAYASALLAIDLAIPVVLSIALAGVITAVIGTLLVFPAFRMRGHYVAIATLAIGQIVALVILNWDSLTHGPIGVSGIPPLQIAGVMLYDAAQTYWFVLVVVVVLALLQARLLSSHLGRTWRALRDDDIAARSHGINPNRYKAMAFAFGGFGAGVGGAVTAHIYSYINHETFNAPISILALTIAILGGLGNISGAMLGSVLLIGLPELFRGLAEYRVLIYGIVLLLLIRVRPQGLLGTA